MQVSQVVCLPANFGRNAFLRLRLFRLVPVRRVLQFRPGCHKLPMWLGSTSADGSPCGVPVHALNMGALGDESHVVLESPAEQAAQAPYANLNLPGCSVLQLMRHANTCAVAKCILACFRSLWACSRWQP